MRFSFEMNERVALFLVGLVAAVSAIGIATGAPGDLGHGPSEIGPGTFYGGGNYIFPATSNVGIGATNPTAKLEVDGQVKITGGSPAEGKVLTSDASGLATWKNAAPLTGNSSSMVLPAGATYTVLCWGTYSDCVDSSTSLLLDGVAVKTYSGNGDSAGCDQNTIMAKRTGVASGTHTWSFSRGGQWDFMWVVYAE